MSWNHATSPGLSWPVCQYRSVLYCTAVQRSAGVDLLLWLEHQYGADCRAGRCLGVLLENGFVKWNAPKKGFCVLNWWKSWRCLRKQDPDARDFHDGLHHPHCELFHLAQPHILVCPEPGSNLWYLQLFECSLTLVFRIQTTYVQKQKIQVGCMPCD